MWIKKNEVEYMCDNADKNSIEPTTSPHYVHVLSSVVYPGEYAIVYDMEDNIVLEKLRGRFGMDVGTFIFETTCKDKIFYNV